MTEEQVTPGQRRSLEMIANGTPAMFHVSGVYRSCSLCAAHIEVARESLGWASLPEMGGVPRRSYGWPQGPAMVLSVAGAALVADPHMTMRLVGFLLFLLANLTWLAWGWSTRAWALVIMQALFTLTSLRGLWSNA
jgi:hypothetical protein